MRGHFSILLITFLCNRELGTCGKGASLSLLPARMLETGRAHVPGDGAHRSRLTPPCGAHGDREAGHELSWYRSRGPCLCMRVRDGDEHQLTSTAPSGGLAA